MVARRPLFGTDGVRGVANSELTPELVLALGRAAARVLGGTRFVIGRDTRCSGPLLVAALSAGLAAEGVDAVDAGVLPTPAVAALSESLAVPAAMISASHNPFPDNGVKLFASGGRKLDVATEERLEGALASLLAGAEPTPPPRVGRGVGQVTSGSTDDLLRTYVERVRAALEGRRLVGVHLVLDCANGASSGVAPSVFEEAGARVDVLHAEPDGTNINERCGSTDPESLRLAVAGNRADLGLAFDGDADRVVAVDHEGSIVDGDQLLALFATDLRERRRLKGATVVITVMTNLGFRRAMAEHDIDVHETPVGDRHVLEALEAGGWSLGGEQSGHLVFRDLATTGDGILTGLLLADLVHRRRRPLSELAAEAMTRLPQVLRSLRVADRDALPGATEVWDDVASVESELGDEGRVVLRASGTEPLVRVMVEATTAARAESAAERLCHTVARVLGSDPAGAVTPGDGRPDATPPA